MVPFTAGFHLHLISVKSGITYRISHNYAKIKVDLSSVKWGLLVRNEVGLFQIFNHVKTIKNH